MKFLNIKIIGLATLFAMLMLIVSSCDNTTEFPITNDLRVLQVKIGNNTITSGINNVSVIPELQIIFSHALNSAAFESALSLSPTADFDIVYDASGSFATLTFPTPLEYETEYTIELPIGAYGANGETSIEKFSFVFTTSAFEPPTVTLIPSSTSFFEGEMVSMVAMLDRAILQNVSLDVTIGGSATLDVDFSVDGTNFSIPSGATSDTIWVTALNDGTLEGEETIVLTAQNEVNAVLGTPSTITLMLGDQAPALELKGVMELDNYINGTDGRVRAIHLRVLGNVTDLSSYGIEIASNGAAPDPTNIDFTFPNQAANEGDDLLIVRDADAADAAAYFGSCYTNFTVFTTSELTQNGDDAIILYNTTVAIESFGVPGVDGTGEPWEYTDSWAYKLGNEWIYAGVGCVTNSGAATTDATSECRYPYCAPPLQLQGVMAILWDASGTNGGKAVHFRANHDIADLSQYGLGVANNGGGTDGVEYNFPVISINEGDHILVAREPGTLASYFGNCYNQYDHTLQSDAMNQNGDDAIELFDGTTVIETYGDAGVDGTGEAWEYAGSWGYKIGKWTYAGVSCAAGSTSTQGSPCPYEFCN